MYTRTAAAPEPPRCICLLYTSVADAVVKPGPAFTDYRYDVTVSTEQSTAAVCVDTAAGNLVWIDGQETTPNRAVNVDLHIGSQIITLTVKSPETGISVNEYMHISRETNPSSLYREKYRPQLHFSPAINWLNDPNGLMYNEETKEYHLFYQYNPYGYDWGNMSWGHAVSKDMMHWEQKDVALYTDELGAIFSGCGVIDRYNTCLLYTSHPLLVIPQALCLPVQGVRRHRKAVVSAANLLAPMAAVMVLVLTCLLYTSRCV